MSANGQFHSPGPNDWVEQLRKTVRREPMPVDEAVLDAAYDAGEIDTATMFAYFEGRLSEEERLEVEAEAAASSHALNKLSRIGAIVAQSRAGAMARPAPPSQQFVTADPEPCLTRSISKSPRVVHRVALGQPRASIGSTLPRSEDCIRSSADSPCEFYRSLEKGRDQVRVFHHSAPVGTLVGLRISHPNTSANPSDTAPTQFAVLRRGTESTTTTTLTVPLSFKRSEVILEMMEIPLSELTAEDGNGLLNSYEKAAEEDPIAVSPLHEPRSAWQLWADEVLKTPSNPIDPMVREVAELIASS